MTVNTVASSLFDVGLSSSEPAPWVEKGFNGNYYIPHKDLEKNSEL